MRRRNVAAILGVTPKHVDRLRREGKLRGIPTRSGRWRYSRAEVLRFLGYPLIVLVGLIGVGRCPPPFF
jgi:predicted site-specific integrase-resolvase